MNLVPFHFPSDQPSFPSFSYTVPLYTDTNPNMGVQDERPASADGPDHGAEEHVEIINSRSNIDEEKSAPGSGDHPKPSVR